MPPRKSFPSIPPPSQTISTITSRAELLPPRSEPIVPMELYTPPPIIISPPIIQAVPRMANDYITYSGNTQKTSLSSQFIQSGSILPLQTFASVNEPLYVPIGDAGPGFTSTFSTIYVTNGVFSTIASETAVFSSINTSTIEASTGNFETISTNQLFANSTVSNFISTSFLDANDILASTIFAYEVFIDNQGLTATPNELLLNGVPLATLSTLQSLSSIVDWSLYPAISTVFMNNNDISGAGTIDAFSGKFQNVNTDTLTVNTLVAQSTVNVYSTITTVALDVSTITAGTTATSSITASSAELYQIGFSSLNGSIASIDSITFSTLSGQSSFVNAMTTSTLTLTGVSSGSLSVSPAGSLLFNGSTISIGAGGDVTNWALYPAISTVNMAAQQLFNAGLITTSGLVSGGNVIAGCNVTASNNVTGNLIFGCNVAAVQNVTAQGDMVAAGSIACSNTITAINNDNGTNLLNGATTIYGGVNGTLSFTTNAGLNGFRATTGVASIASAAAITLAAGGAMSLAAGGAINIAAGDYIELDAGKVQLIGGSSLEVNQIKTYNAGNINIFSPVFANSNIATPVLITNTLTTLLGPVSVPVGIKDISSITQLSSINGSSISEFFNQPVSSFNFIGADAGQISTLSVNTINGFPYTPSNSLTGLDLYLDTAGGTTPQTGALLASPNTGTQTLITSGNQTNATVLVASFISDVGVVQNRSIIQGFWSLGLYTGAATTSGVSVYYSAYYVDADGVSNKTAIAVGTAANAVSIASGVQTINNIDLFVPATTLPDTTKRIQIDIYGIFVGGSKSLTMEFRDNTVSHLHTTIINIPQNVTFNTATISSLNASSISAYYVGVSALETASIDKVSTLIASSITTNYISVFNIENVSSITTSTINTNFITAAAIETASIDRVSSLTASTVTTNFIRVGQIENVSSIIVSTINGQPTVPFLAQYYKTATQNFPTGSTNVTWDAAQPWTNTGGYITQTNVSTFTVQRPGVYQFEFAVSVSANAQTWATVPTKDIRINVTRSPGTPQSLFFNRITPQTALDWANSVIGTGALTTGDQIVCNLGQTLVTAGNCLIQSLSNVFDTNTAFTWTLIKPL